MSKNMNEMFENLQEGILVLENNSINFSNQIFDNILRDINLLDDNEAIKDLVLE